MIKGQSDIWPYKGEALVCHKNFLPLKKISPPFNYYVMKIILSNGESCEDETKYSPIGQTTAELRSFLCLDVGKIMEKE